MTSIATTKQTIEQRLPSDVFVYILEHLTGLDLLRFNVISVMSHKLSSLNLNLHWKNYLKLSDKIRASTYIKSKGCVKYATPLNREQTIARMKLRCQYCRANTKYKDEFAMQRNVQLKTRCCLQCEKTKRNSTYRMMTQTTVLKQGLSEKMMLSLPSISRTIDSSIVRVFLKTDVDAMLNQNRESSSSSDEEWEDKTSKQVKMWNQRTKSSNNQCQQTKTKQKQINRRPRQTRQRCHRSNGRRQNRQQNQKWSTSASSQYELNISGLSCLVLAD